MLNRAYILERKQCNYKNYNYWTFGHRIPITKPYLLYSKIIRLYLHISFTLSRYNPTQYILSGIWLLRNSLIKYLLFNHYIAKKT